MIQFLTDLYGLVPKKRRLLSLLYTPVRGTLRRIAMPLLPLYFSVSPLDLNRKRYDKVIVSLTTFPARIKYVHIVIQNMLRQSVLPHKIILWLSKEEFSSLEALPESLVGLQNDIFEIRFVDGNIEAHKNYYYASLEYTNYQIVLVDDDILYPIDMLEDLHNAYRRGSVVCRYGRRVSRDENGELKPYKSWPHLMEPESGNDLFFGPGGGSIFCPDDFTSELTDIVIARKLTPYSNDIWLNAMARVAHLKISIIKHRRFFPLYIPNAQPLCEINLKRGESDKKLRNVIEYFREFNIFTL